MIREQRLVDLFCRLVAIDAPSLRERAMADQVSVILNDLGCRVSEDNAGEELGGNCNNLYACLPGSMPGPALLFGVHLDTVDPCLGKEAVIGSDKIIRSNGETILGADDLAGLTAVIEAIQSLREDRTPHRTVEILLSVAEEKHLLGINQAEFSRLSAREAYVLDTCGQPGTAILQAPGHVALVFEVFGQAAHAGIAPETGISAIRAAAAGIARMKLGRVDADTTANIGLISGGGETNVVADYCRVTAECRSLSIEKLEQQVAHLCGCMEQGARETGARLQIQQSTSYQPYRISPESPVVKRFTRACRKMGLPVHLITTGGGSDNNVLVLNGIEGIVISCGMMQVHSCQEYIRVADLVQTAALVRELIAGDPAGDFSG
ncbi:MAG TPA: peptidase T [Clostridiales bacterium]|nr:peptidase T [Clostridiales bacterium]